MKRMTKKDYVASINMFLSGDLSGIDQTLIDTCKYATEHPDKSTIADLKELQSEIDVAIKEAVQKQEEAKKSEKSSRTSSKKPADKKPVDKSLKKPLGKKPAATKPESKKNEVKTTSNKSHPSVLMFPEELNLKFLGDDATLVKSKMTYEELRKAMDEEKPVYIVGYWNPAQIKQFYFDSFKTMPDGRSFEHDLDLYTPLYACERIDRIICVSNYTEAVTFFDKDDFTEVENKDPHTGESFPVKIANGMEFEVYTMK